MRAGPDGGSGGVRDRGVAAVEFALVLPVLVVLIFLIVSAGSIYLDQLNMQSAVRNAARIGSLNPPMACEVARDELSSNSVGMLGCTLLSDCSAGRIRVQLVSHQVVSIPLVGHKDVTLHATSSYSCSP